MSNNYDSMHSLDLKPNPMYMPNPSKRLFHDAMETPYSDTSLSSKTKRKESQRQDQKSLWSMEEDKLMKKLLKDAKPPINWKRVAEHFHDKNELQCQTHWEKLTNPELYEKCKKKPWTEEEDALVIELVQKHGPQKWTFIADHLPGRIGKQCRERWHNHLNPKIKKSAWTNEEEWLLFLSHKAAGSRWAEITKNIPGRTDNSIKNHWNSSMKKRIPELTAKFQRIRETGGLTNPVNVSNISALEYELLEKTLTMDEGDYHVKNETTYETKKPKAAKNKNYEPKGRSKNSSTDMKHYSSQNHLAKIDDTSIKPYSDNTTSSPNSMMDSLRKIQDSAHNSVFDNLVKTKLDFSIQDLDPKNPEHLQLINQIYHQPNMQAYYNSHQSIAPADYNHSRPHFGDDHSLGKDNSHYMSKKEPEYHKQNEHTANTSFYTKEFGIQSPALKLDTKPFGNEATNDQYFHQNNENRNTLNYSKPDSFRDNALFESPPQRKKQKFNPMHSPNIPDTESNSKTNSKILDRTNRANLNIQGFPKDFVGFNAYAYSPLNLKYESPSKMMNFCTPERNRDVHLDSAGKQIFFNMNPIEKSPSLFINKNYYTFDKPSTLKF